MVLTDTGPRFPCDPLTGALFGSTEVNLRRYHPTPTNAWLLWETHMDNVEPLYKTLHTPTTSAMVRGISLELAVGYRSHECLLFSIYHFAVFSMSEEDCHSQLGHSRHTLLEQYNFAAKQALVNASFLRTAEISVLQALVLLLLASRDRYDANTFWTLTGVAMRIAQRIGIHKDGEKLGLPPFEVEMRRRLISQLLPLDVRASQMAGVETSTDLENWDTLLPSNINDDQIWPGMTEEPEHRAGATDMMFCLSRMCLVKYFVKIGRPEGAGVLVLGQSGSDNETEQVVKQAESEVEKKYIRYCDVINPLHFLTVCMVRSGIAAMRLRIQLPKAIDHIDPGYEVTEALQLAFKILDTDAAVCSHPGLDKYHWHTKAFFLWGTWDSFIFVLTLLLKNVAVSQDEVDAMWKRVEGMYWHHDDLFESKRPFYRALGHLAVKAWEARSPRETTNGMGDPGFITILRLAPGTDSPRPSERSQDNEDTSLNTEIPTEPGPLSTLTSVPGPSQGGMPSGMSFDADSGFEIDAADWDFWDQLIKGHEARNDK